MSVTATHPQYRRRVSQWIRCRDAADGTDAIKGKTTTYVPKPTNMLIAAYRRRIDAGLWYGAMGRAVQVLAGVISRKDPAVTFPENHPKDLKPYLEDITLSGVPFPTFVDQCEREAFKVGRVGIYVTRPGEESEDNRPYLVLYEAEQIVNWRTQRISGRNVLTMVVLKETTTESGDDEFELEEVEQYRVLRLVSGDGETAGKRVLEVSEYREVDGDWGPIGEAKHPIRNGERLEFIPFVFCNTFDLLQKTDKPPLLDLTDINIAHFKNSVIYETALKAIPPTLFLKSVDAPEKVVVGNPEVAISSQSADGDAKFVQYDAAGTGELKTAMDDKKKDMAAIAARALETQQLDPEAENTVRVRRQGESSMVQVVAINLGQALTTALRHIAWWEGFEDEALDEVGVHLNTDLSDVRLSGADLTALVDAFFRGAISWATFYENLRSGEIAREGVTAEEEFEDIKSSENEDLDDRERGESDDDDEIEEQLEDLEAGVDA